VTGDTINTTSTSARSLLTVDRFHRTAKPANLSSLPPPSTATRTSKVPATVSFGVGLNTAQPNNTPNHRVLPQDIHIETGSVVNFMVAGFHQIFVYKPGVTLDQIVSPATGTFVNQHVDMLYYQGLLPAGGPPPGIAATTNPSNAMNRVESAFSRRVRISSSATSAAISWTG